MNAEKLKELFYQEAEDLINRYESALLGIEKNENKSDHVNDLFRSVHTLKSSSAIVEMDRLSQFFHHFENILDEVRNGNIEIDEGFISFCYSVEDFFKKYIESGDDSMIEQDPLYEKFAGRFERYLNNETVQDVSEEDKKEETSIESANEKKYYRILLKLGANLFETGTDPFMLLGEISDFCDMIHVDCNISKVPGFDEIDFYKLYSSWELIIGTHEDKTLIENVFVFVVDENNKIIIDEIDPLFLVDEFGIDLEECKEAEIAVKEEKEPDTEVSVVAKEKDVYQRPVTREQVEAPIMEKKASNGHVVEAKKELKANPKQKDLKMSSLNKMKPGNQKNTARKPVQKVSTIRVDTQKLDKLVNLVSEMVISVARLNQISIENRFIQNRDMRSNLENLIRFSRDLQEQVMRVRMIPVEGTFNRFFRIVRDMSRELNKKIRIEMFGTETELDKNVIEQLGDPLKHLIRNSIDHGIESSEDRLKKGKPEEGVINLKAYQQEGSIIIEITDDGKGIDRHAVYNKALERGLIDTDMDYSDEEIFQFIFMPGFSTAKKVTEISGRGVGLDVVKKNIDDLKGSIEIQSEVDKGTSFRIKLPLTLAIIDGMIVKVGNESITIPLMSIIESIKPHKEDIKSLENEGELIEVRGEYLPLVRLHKLFDFQTEKRNPVEGLVVIIEGNQKKFGLLVDDIIGEQQAVIKSLEKNFMQVKGTSGATILGDGNLSLILDVFGIEKLAFNR